MKTIFNLLLVTMFVLVANVGCKKSNDPAPTPSVQSIITPPPPVGPTYCVVDTVYDFTNNYTICYIQNNMVQFNDNTLKPTKHLTLTINNTVTTTGTFTLSQGNYLLIYADGTYYSWATKSGSPVGSVTITTNTDTYMEGTFTFDAERINPTTQVNEHRIYKGTFGGKKQ